MGQAHPYDFTKEIKGRSTSVVMQGLKDEAGYCQLVASTMRTGVSIPGRNGSVRSTFGACVSYDLTEGRIPVFTTKKVAWKTCLRELLWFLRGGTDAKELDAAGCKIWNANGSRSFLDGRGLTDYPEGVLGPVYGWQWRAFNAPYDANNPTRRGGVDQLKQVLDAMANPNTRYSRRHLVSAWNPSQLDQMALPPCHVLFQFHVVPPGEAETAPLLHCSLYQRSADLGLGVPFNVTSYGFLTHMVARKLGFRPGRLYHHIGDAHVYENHIEALGEQLCRAPLDPPRLEQTWSCDLELDQIKESDITLLGYTPLAVIKMPMSA